MKRFLAPDSLCPVKTILALFLAVFGLSAFGQGGNVFIYGERADARRDSFGRLRVSQPETIFDSPGFLYDLKTNVWESITGGSGSVTLNAADQSVILANAAGNTTHFARRASYERFRRRSGKGLMIVLSGILGVQPAAVRSHIGYGDQDNGVFFENWAGTNNVLLRSKASGTLSETRLPLSDWGGSVADFDASKVQTFGIDISEVGGGTVRCYVQRGLEWRQVALWNNANTLTTVFMATGRLPILYEIENTGTGTLSSMRQIGSAVFIEGGDDEGTGHNRSAATAVGGVSVSAARAVIGIRPAATLGGLTNRARIRINGITANAPNTRLSLVYRPSSVANSAWTNTLGAVTYDLNGDTVTGGVTLATWVAGASVPLDLCSHPLALNYQGNVATELYVVATPVSGTNSVSVAINWVEDY